VWGGPNAQALGVVLVRGLLGGSGYAIDCQVTEPSARLWAVVSAGSSAAEVNGVVFANGRGYIGGALLFAGVNSVAVYAQDPDGKRTWKAGFAATTGRGNMVFACSMDQKPIVTSGVVFAHEFIHTCGFLDHRERSRAAIMYKTVDTTGKGGNEINRSERLVLE
jgi:hypothetical protein